MSTKFDPIYRIKQGAIILANYDSLKVAEEDAHQIQAELYREEGIRYKIIVYQVINNHETPIYSVK